MFPHDKTIEVIIPYFLEDEIVLQTVCGKYTI